MEIKLNKELLCPEQISAVFANNHIGQVSHEMIYPSIDRNKAVGDLHRHLRDRCKSYIHPSLERERRGNIKNQVMIDKRARIGDSKMDPVIGSPQG